jgi:hypothetical protein
MRWILILTLVRGVGGCGMDRDIVIGIDLYKVFFHYRLGLLMILWLMLMILWLMLMLMLMLVLMLMLMLMLCFEG